ncbi:MAG: ABC transporter permease [Dehalococcoidales bacterium]|nr:ABC transporter permease [Dehalococcoidales bacterium]
MIAEKVTQVDSNEIAPRINETRRFVRVFFQRRIVIFGLAILLLMFFSAAFAPLISPYDPLEQNLREFLQQPSSSHLLGTDNIGRDTLSRLIWGARTAAVIGFLTVAFSAIIGTTFGILAGYFSGTVNTIIMRITDVFMPFPMIVLAMLFATVLGGGMTNIILALGIATTPAYIRVICGMALSVKENDYILAEKAMGASDLRIMIRHVLPNSFAPIIVTITLQLGFVILSEASLSFLGIGIRPPTPAWGSMVNDGYHQLTRVPILSFAPGAAIMLVVFAFNVVGDALRDALDPRLRGTL